ncbi:MAG: hypothetical protein JWR26_4052 [Pedosphaera sp.]|nr:hypothetical protein [Pedosphaera sp.]
MASLNAPFATRHHIRLVCGPFNTRVNRVGVRLVRATAMESSLAHSVPYCYWVISPAPDKLASSLEHQTMGDTFNYDYNRKRL